MPKNSIKSNGYILALKHFKKDYEHEEVFMNIHRKPKFIKVLNKNLALNTR